MYIPKQLDPFNRLDWQTAYCECQYQQLETINQLKEELAKTEQEYQTAIAQHETRRARWFAKTIPLLKQRISKLEAAYSAGKALIDSMAISLGLENQALKTRIKKLEDDLWYERKLSSHFMDESIKNQTPFN